MLNNTGTTGGLTVTGGGSTTQGGDNSGGTIQNTTGHGISLTNTTGPSFRNMHLLNTGDSGVNGTQVNGFSFTDGRITGAGDASRREQHHVRRQPDGDAEPDRRGHDHQQRDQPDRGRGRRHRELGRHDQRRQHLRPTRSRTRATWPRRAARSRSSAPARRRAPRASPGRRSTNNTITDFRAGVGVQVRAGNPNAGGPTGSAGTAGSATNVIAITGNSMNGGNAGIGNQPDRFFTGGVSGNGGQGNFNVSNNGTAANRIRNIDCIAIEMQIGRPGDDDVDGPEQLHQREQRGRLRRDRGRHRRPERPRRRHALDVDLRATT